MKGGSELGHRKRLHLNTLRLTTCFTYFPRLISLQGHADDAGVLPGILS